MVHDQSHLEHLYCLRYRSAVFEGAPVQPLLMLVHERRTTESHELMLKWLAKLCGTAM